MFSQDAADQQFLNEIGRRHPTGGTVGKLEESIKKYPKLYKEIVDKAKAAPASDTSWKDTARAKYGWIVDLYDALPELQKVIDSAVQAKWDIPSFLNSIKSTAWWKTTEAKERAFVEESNSDPATQKTNIESKRLEINKLVGKQGYTLSDASLANLAVQAYKYGWDTNELDRYVGAEVLKTGVTGTTKAPVTSGMDADTVRGWASDFGLKLTSKDIDDYTKGLIGKTLTAEQIKSNMKMDAENLYPALKGQLESGRTVAQATATYRAIAANTLGIDGATIDFSDANKWGKLLSYVDPDKGEARLMNSTEWGRFLRNLPEWQQTDDAKSVYRDVASTIVRGFGKVRGA